MRFPRSDATFRSSRGCWRRRPASAMITAVGLSNPRWAQMEQQTMKAVVRDAYGSVEVLRLGEVDKPAAGEGEVLVRVHAAGGDQGVWHLMAGMPYVMRLAGVWICGPEKAVVGA